MGDVVSSHLDERRREMITAHTRCVMKEFSNLYKQQYAVALFNSVRFEIEGGGGTQSQLLHRKDPLAGRSIFSGSLFQYLEENQKWRNRFVSVPNSYNLHLYETKIAHNRGLHPKVTIECAGYKALTSLEEYIELIDASLPGIKGKAGSDPFVRSVTQFPLILWHPYAHHHYFSVMTEKEQKKWHAVLQDCIRHSNNGLPEDHTVQTPAFTDAVRLHRQAKGHYGTWDMMCGAPPQILAHLVMETLHPELRDLIGPRLKGNMQQRQKSWMLISDAVYRQVLSQTTRQYNALVEACETQRVALDGKLRTDMDQIITSKEHIMGKIRALVLPKAEQLLRSSVQPYISSILEALMEPTSRGFAEVRDVFFKELVEISKNSLNKEGTEKLRDHMERLSMLAFHPVKMQGCYEKVEELNLEGLQQRFDVSSPSVFVGRAQILMNEQMDNAVYTFEQLLHQSYEAKGEDDFCKTIQRCQDRVLKKFDYDSSTVRKKFFREALLQIIIPYMLQNLSPSCSPELPRFQEFIFEDCSRFLLVENMFEEVVLQSVTKDIMMAVKEAAVQRKHNLYRDSIILTNSDPNLHLLEDTAPVDWATKFGGDEAEGSVSDGGTGGGFGTRRRQVVSMIQPEGVPLPYESCLEVPGVELIPEEDADVFEDEEKSQEEDEEHCGPPQDPMSPDSVNEIRDLINPVVEMAVPVSGGRKSSITNGPEPTTSTITLEDGVQEQVALVSMVVEDVPRKSPRDKMSPQTILKQLVGSRKKETDEEHQEEAATKNDIKETETAVQTDDNKRIPEVSAEKSDSSSPLPPLATDSSSHDNTGFQSPSSVGLDESELRAITNHLAGDDKIIDLLDVEVSLA